MNQRLKKLCSVSTLTLLLTLSPVAAIAQGNNPNEPVANETLQATGVESQAQDDPGKLKSRLDERKAAMKTRLDNAKQNRLKTRCKASQGKISSISGRINGLETSRSQVYANMIERLTNLNNRLKEASVDTAQLDLQITQLTSLIDTFTNDLDSYRTAVSDLVAMDCATDPTGFQATLETARTARTKTSESAQAIRTYLTGTIKPTLSGLKAQVAGESE